MTQYEKLLDEAVESGLTIIENYDLSGTKIKGLYCDGTIALSNDLHTDADRLSILYEEIGHHNTSVGNILDLHDTSSCKQELRARIDAYNNAIGLDGLKNALLSRVSSFAELADYFEVTEEFLSEALTYYKSKYGIFTTIDKKYVLYFEPLGILDII